MLFLSFVYKLLWYFFKYIYILKNLEKKGKRRTLYLKGCRKMQFIRKLEWHSDILIKGCTNEIKRWTKFPFSRPSSCFFPYRKKRPGCFFTAWSFNRMYLHNITTCNKKRKKKHSICPISPFRIFLHRFYTTCKYYCTLNFHYEGQRWSIGIKPGECWVWLHTVPWG